MHRLGWVVMVFVVGFLWLPAVAGAVSLTLEGWADGNEPLYYEFTRPDGNVSYHGAGGELSVTLGEGNDGLRTIAYCVQLDELIYPGITYDVTLREPWSKRQGLSAAWLMNEFAPGLSDENRYTDLGYTHSEAGAALQLAIWQVIHDDALKVSRTWNSENILGLYDRFLGRLEAARLRADLRYSFDISWISEVQDLLVYRQTPRPEPVVAPVSPVQPTPEPGTLLLLLIGLGGWMGLRRRRWKRGR